MDTDNNLVGEEGLEVRGKGAAWGTSVKVLTIKKLTNLDLH